MRPNDTNSSFLFKNPASQLDICAAHNSLTRGQFVLSMPSLGVSSLDFDRVGDDAVFFYASFSDRSLGGERQSGEVVFGDGHQVGGETRQVVGERIETR